MANIQRFFENDPFDILFKDFFKSGSPFSTAVSSNFNYPVDIVNTKDATIIDIAAAGLDKDDISVTYEDECLRVKYQKNQETEEKGEDGVTVVHRGITRRSFDQAWKLGRKYDVEAIKTKLDKGILTITIPFKKDAQQKQFNIEVE